MKFFLSNITAGIITAFVMLCFGISYGTMVFSDPELSRYVPYGIHASLMSTWALLIVNSLLSSCPFSLAGPDSNSTVVLSLIGTTLFSQLAAQNKKPDEIIPIILSVFTVLTIGIGVLSYLLGRFKQGRNMRFIPYSVIGGFLGGTGVLVLLGGLKVLLGKSVSPDVLSNLSSAQIFSCLIALLICLGMVLIPRVSKFFLTIPFTIIGGIIFFYACLWLQGIPLEVAREKGLLVAAANFQLPLFGHLSGFTDGCILAIRNFFLLLPVVVIVIITTLINSTGLEVATESDSDFNKELESIGVGLIASGFFGGLAGHLSASRSILHVKTGATSRLAGICAGVLCGTIAFRFPDIVQYFPKPVLAGILVALGCEMISKWIYEPFIKSSKSEFLLVSTAVVSFVFLGALPGLLVSLTITALVFIFDYARIPCIRRSFCAGNYFSNKDRPIDDISILFTEGKKARIACLQGFIFFGSANSLLDIFRGYLEKDPIRYFLMDFSFVQGIDPSATYGFKKIIHFADRYKVSIVVTGLKSSILESLSRAECLPKNVRIEEDLDRGLEWIEDNLLALSGSGCRIGLKELGMNDAHNSSGLVTEASCTASPIIQSDKEAFTSIFSAYFPSELSAILVDFCEAKEILQDEFLFKKEEPADGMYFVEEGQFSVWISLPGGDIKRLRAFGPGSIVGEMSLYSQEMRTADVKADTFCRVKKLSKADITKMEAKHPKLSSALQTFIIKVLASRLAAANEQLKSFA